MTQPPDWGQVAALMAVLSGISSLVTWIFMRGLVQPQISRDIEKSMKATREWAVKEFALKSAFDLHEFKDTQRHNELSHRLQDTITDLDTTSERVATMREDVLLLKQRRTNG